MTKKNDLIIMITPMRKYLMFLYNKIKILVRLVLKNIAANVGIIFLLCRFPLSERTKVLKLLKTDSAYFEYHSD